MAFKRCVMIMTAVLVLSVRVEHGAAQVEGLMKRLSVSKAQIDFLTAEVCQQLFYSGAQNRNTKFKTCVEKFADSGSKFSSLASKFELAVRSEQEVSFRIPAADRWQLAILVPSLEDGFINFCVVHVAEDSCNVMADAPTNYTVWTTELNQDGTPSVWLRGPDVLQWSSVKIDNPIFKYNIINNDVIAIFVLDFIKTISSVSEVLITNSCNKMFLDNFSQTLRTDANLTVMVEGVPLDDDCSLTVRGGRGGALRYHSPPCDQLDGCGDTPAPEIPRDIVASAARSGSGAWDVLVRWAPPVRRPDAYNVSLYADRVHSANISGNSTEVTFRDVTGKRLYDVSVQAVYGYRKALTSRRALFPEVDGSSVSGLTVAAWCGALAAAALLVAAAALWWRRRRNYLRGNLYFPGLDQDKLPRDWGSETGGEADADDRWEVRPERVLLHEVIGEGAFGVVRKGTLAPAGKDVAVKMLKDFPTLDEVRSFRFEMKLMKDVGVHPHIVSLVGCCTGRRPLIVAEYCSRGDLLSYLRCFWDVMVSRRNAKYYNNNLADCRNNLFKSKPQREHSKLVVNKLYDLQGICDADLTSLDLLSFCRQIAMGMEFLALNKVVHRDLAARNVLVSGDRTLKIADFGLSRDVYQENQYKQKGNGKMPVKWMALESLTHRIYTTQSDVWSFGVVVWEVVTVGAAPYPEVPAARLSRLLRAGYRMPRPNNCTKQLYELMLSCWRARPRDRPTFAELHAQLDELLNSTCADEYLILELEDEDVPAPPVPRSQRYVKMILRGNRLWARGENYEQPLKGPQSNHYSSPPAPLARPQVV